jgi:hypothetical protein
MGETILNAARKHACIRLLFVLIAVAGLAALLVACGGGHKRKLPISPIVPDQGQQQETNPWVEEVENTPLPDGIDAEVWAALTTELITLLEGMTEEDRDPVEFDWKAEFYGFGASWDSRFMRFDSNDDARVDVLDLIPLAEHFGEDWVDGGGGPDEIDYERDYVIDLDDVGPIARNYGLTCSGFQVELSSESAEAGFEVAGTVDYDDTGLHGWYRFPCETRGLEPLWLRVTVLDDGGEPLASQVWDVPMVDEETTPLEVPNGTHFGVIQIEGLPRENPTVTWSTQNLMPDGNQDGVVNLFDGWALADLFGSVDEDPARVLGDYDGNGQVSIADVTPAAMHQNNNVDNFVVEVSTTSPDDGFTENGTVGYFDSVGFNEFGFRYYEYEIANPPAEPFWVRVVPYGLNGDRGEPSEAVAFNAAE